MTVTDSGEEKSQQEAKSTESFRSSYKMHVGPFRDEIYEKGKVRRGGRGEEES